MKMKNLALIIMVVLSSIIVPINLQAQKHGHGGKGNGGGRSNKVVKTKVVRTNHGHLHTSQRVVKNRPLRYSRSKVVVVKQRRVRTVAVLPLGYTTIGWRGKNYFYHGGYYYNNLGNAFNVINPLVGIRVKVLPVGYRKIFIGPVPHYYYMGAYYKEVNSEYETVEPTVGTRVPELPEDNVDEVTIDGQTYYEFDNLLYKRVVTEEGVKYEVVGKLDD